MVRWVKPRLPDELEEVRRTANALGYSLNKIFEAIESGKLISLDDDTWSTLENSDSWETLTERSARNLAQEYGKDFDRIKDGFVNSAEIPAPIILTVNGKNPYLVAGNTRLMASRALDQRPTVLLAEISE
jgi:hypothetical protein